MYSPEISDADFKYAIYAKDHTDNYQIRRRMQMIYLLYKRYQRGEIADIIGVTAKTITEWVKLYISGGRDALCQLHYQGQMSELHQPKDTIKTVIDESKPSTIGEIARLIEQHTGIGRSLTQVRFFVRHHLEIIRRKVQPLPGGKLSLEELAAKQRQFVKETLSPLLQKALDRQVPQPPRVFFCDAVHPVQGFYTGYIYSSEVHYMRSASGRHRFNMLSALNAVELDLFTVYGSKYVSANTTIELMELVQAHHPNEQIYLIMDNARYQHCRLVAQEAERLGIELVFLPAYSPNLNLIERLWKYLKKKVLAGKYYATKEAFENAILTFLEEVEKGIHDSHLEALITFNFQSLDKQLEKLTNLAS